MDNICNILSEVAARHPDSPALVDRKRGRRRELSFGDLEATTAGGVEQLRSAGLKPGDTVLFFHPVSIELYTAMLAVFRAGMTAMFVDPSAGRGLIDACCKLRRPQAFFGSPKAHLLRLKSRAVRRVPVKFHSGGVWLPGSRRWSPQAAAANNTDRPEPTDAPALITFTSGSTGQPKGVARSHEFLIAQHLALENALQLKAGEIDLITLPVFTLANLGSGLTSVLADTDLARPGEADAETVARQIVADGVRRVAASPAFFEALLERPESLAPLKRIATGGAPVFPPLLNRLAAAAPEAEVYAVYGSTEAEPIAHVERSEISVEDIAVMRAGGGLLVGRPVPEIELRIIADRWGEAIAPLADRDAFEKTSCLPAGQNGEIVVSGAHVLKGYLNGVGDEETKFRVADQVWHRTGDAGRLEADGRLWLMGRCAAKMTEASVDGGGGLDLYPFAVECALSFLPNLRRSAAVAHRGEKVLVLEVDPGAAAAETLEEIRPQVAWAKFDRLVACEKIPVDRRHQAKVDYSRLIAFLDHCRE